MSLNCIEKIALSFHLDFQKKEQKIIFFLFLNLSYKLLFLLRIATLKLPFIATCLAC